MSTQLVAYAGYYAGYYVPLAILAALAGVRALWQRSRWGRARQHARKAQERERLARMVHAYVEGKPWGRE